MFETRWNVNRCGLLCWSWEAERRKADGTWFGVGGKVALRRTAFAKAEATEAVLLSIPDEVWGRPGAMVEIPT